MAIYVSAGIIYANHTISGDRLFILSGGVADQNSLNDEGYMYVSNGGMASSTTMNEGAGGHISSGGVAKRTTVNDGATLGVFSGGTIESTTINSGGGVIFFYGATADSTTVSSGGVFGIGGTANSTTVYEGATVQVLNNGVANSTTVNRDAYLEVLKGGTADSTTVYHGELYVSSGGSANATVLTNSAVLSACGSGAELTSTTVNDKSKLYVVDSAFAFSNTVNDAWLYVSKNGAVGSTTLDNSLMYVSGGGYAYWTINSGGWIIVQDEGTMEQTGLMGSGGMLVGPGGWISGTVVSSAGLGMTGGSARGTWVYAGGSFSIANDVEAEKTLIFENGCMSIAGGSANDITVGVGADLEVSSGGTATAIKENGGFVLVKEGAVVTFVPNDIDGLSLSNKFASLHSGTTANETTLDDDAELHVYAGGVANNTTVDVGGWLEVFDGGAANGTIVNDSGTVDINNGGTADKTIVNDGGELFVYDGGAANGTVVNDYGYAYVSSGGTVSGTTVNPNGFMYVERGGTAVSTDVCSGGSMFIYNTGKVTGTLNIAEGATVFAYNRSIIDFNITCVAPESPALVIGLSLIQGSTPDFTLTVSTSQECGAYLLAEGAEGFAEAIMVSTDTGIELGAITVGGEIRGDDRIYSLDLTGGLLSLAVTDSAPVVVKPTLGDINGNGISDILFQNLVDPMNPLGAWMDADMWQWNGALGPASKSEWIVYGAYDFTGDQYCDIMFRSTLAETEYAVGYYDMGEGGTFKTMGWGVTAEWELAQCGDFNGNGVADILWHNTETGYHGLWLDGTNEWVALPYSYLTPGQQTVFGVGDITGDGCDDILINSNGTICAWDIAGVIAGTEPQPVLWTRSGIALTSDWATLGAADFDNNGIADIVVWNQNTGLVGAYMGCQSENWVGIYPSASPTEWGIPGFGDYNGDGYDDVLVRNLESGALGYWSGKDNFAWNGIGWGVDSTWAVIA